MFLKKTKNVIDGLRDRFGGLQAQINEVKNEQAEVVWANVFHDTIRDRQWLQTLPLSPGRWAVGYSMLYVIARVLADYKISSVVEFGLGESSKLVDACVYHHLPGCTHVIVEHDQAWIDHFAQRYAFKGNPRLITLDLIEKEIKGNPVKTYKGIQEALVNAADLYVIDAPFGSPRYSRYEIVTIALERFVPGSEFIIILDDYNRQGEQDTIADLLEVLKLKQIKVYTGLYTGSKSQMVIATEKYRHAVSM